MIIMRAILGLIATLYILAAGIDQLTHPALRDWLAERQSMWVVKTACPVLRSLGWMKAGEYESPRRYVFAVIAILVSLTGMIVILLNLIGWS